MKLSELRKLCAPLVDDHRRDMFVTVNGYRITRPGSWKSGKLNESTVTIVRQRDNMVITGGQFGSIVDLFLNMLNTTDAMPVPPPPVQLMKTKIAAVDNLCAFYEIPLYSELLNK